MSTDIEQLLRGGMERATQDVRVPPGLALKAYRHHQKRRVTARAVTAAGTATAVAAGAVAAAGVTGAFGSATGHQAQQATYTTYVVRHVEHALAAPGQQNLLVYTRDVYQPGTILKPVGPFMVLGSRQPGVSSPWSVGSTQTWMYRGTARMSAFSPAGQLVYELGASLPTGQPGSSIAVSDSSRTWWQEPLAARPPVRGPGPVSCGPQIRMRVGTGWAAFIRHQLSCGEYSVAGRQLVDGVNAIKIVSKQGTVALWVSPDSYLPVRVVQDFGGGRDQGDFRWLAPTPANLAHLKVTVPAGFKQVPPPAWWAKD